MMNIVYIAKAIHVIGFVAWFAGLFYLVRMFVYYVEAGEKAEPEKSILQKQHGLMSWRVYKIIANPAMMITWTAGLIMLGLGFTDGVPNYLKSEIGHAGLDARQADLAGTADGLPRLVQAHPQKLEAGTAKTSSWGFRLANEIPNPVPGGHRPLLLPWASEGS
jgi:putative membrane protein